jgi:hypothetical protein
MLLTESGMQLAQRQTGIAHSECTHLLKGIPEGQIPHEENMRRWDDIIKMHLKEKSFDGR